MHKHKQVQNWVLVPARFSVSKLAHSRHHEEQAGARKRLVGASCTGHQAKLKIAGAKIVVEFRWRGAPSSGPAQPARAHVRVRQEPMAGAKACAGAEQQSQSSCSGCREAVLAHRCQTLCTFFSRLACSRREGM